MTKPETPSESAEERPERPAPGVREGACLGPAERVRTRTEFARLRQHGRRGGDQVIRLLVGTNDLEWARIASQVPRRVGNAVVRNRLRRLYREAFRLEKHVLPAGIDIVVSPARGATDPSLEQVRAGLRKVVPSLVRRLGKRKK